MHLPIFGGDPNGYDYAFPIGGKRRYANEFS